MRLSEQKRDVQSTSFYIVMLFILFCVFVIVPIILIIYSHNHNESFPNTYIIVIILYCFFALLSASIFLHCIYEEMKEKSNNKLKNQIINAVKVEFNDQIKKQIKEEAIQNIILNGLGNLFDQQITKSAGEKVDGIFDGEKGAAIECLNRTKEGLNQVLKGQNDNYQRELEQKKKQAVEKINKEGTDAQQEINDLGERIKRELEEFLNNQKTAAKGELELNKNIFVKDLDETKANAHEHLELLEQGLSSSLKGESEKLLDSLRQFEGNLSTTLMDEKKFHEKELNKQAKKLKKRIKDKDDDMSDISD